MSKRTKDFFYKQAKEKGVAARSFYKLEDLDGKYGLIKPKFRVLDIGAAPGSWIQYVANKVGLDGFVLGVDLNPLTITLPNNAQFIQKNVLEISPEEIADEHGNFNLVVSDVAPRTTGNRMVDHERSYELCHHVLSIAAEVLKKNSSFLCKMYQGEHTKKFENEAKAIFSKVKIQKPDASRKESKEIFIVALEKK